MNHESKDSPSRPLLDAERHETAIEIGKLFFEWRDYTPIPLIVILAFISKPSAASATLGLCMLAAGELLRIYSVAFIGTVSRTRSESTGGKVVRTGPFAYVRNPLYVGNFMITMGIAVFGGRPWFVALTALAFALQYYYIVKFEENLLRTKFGDDYLDYCQQVPPWIPRKRINLDQFEWPDTFGPALKSEKRTLTAIVAVVGLLLFLSST